MDEFFRVDQDNPSAEVVNRAAAVLRRGGIVLFPTDTVYGLGALASRETCYGAQELFDIKCRPTGVPVPLLVGGEGDLELYGAQVSESAHKLAAAFWPGPLTIVVKAGDAVLPEFRNAADDTVGLRCPDSELVRELVAAAGGPLFATSANTHGNPAPNDFGDIEERIKAAASLVLDGGQTKDGVSSTIVLCAGEDAPRVVREGSIGATEIEAALAAE